MLFKLSRRPLFLYQTPPVAHLLFSTSTLTEGLEQARFRSTRLTRFRKSFLGNKLLERGEYTLLSILLGQDACWTYFCGGRVPRLTPLKGLTYSPPLTALTHLTGTVSGVFFKRLLSTTNKMADQRNSSYLVSASCTGTIDCYSVQQITLANGNH